MRYRDCFCRFRMAFLSPFHIAKLNGRNRKGWMPEEWDRDGIRWRSCSTTTTTMYHGYNSWSLLCQKLSYHCCCGTEFGWRFFRVGIIWGKWVSNTWLFFFRSDASPYKTIYQLHCTTHFLIGQVANCWRLVLDFLFSFVFTCIIPRL